MAYAFVSGAAVGAQSGSGSVTTGTANFSGVDLIVVVVGARAGDSLSVTSNPSNTFSALTTYNAAADFGDGQMWYCHNPSVSTTMTFTVSGASNVCTIGATGYSGSAASPFDVETGSGTASGNQTTIAAGNITPNFNNELVVAGGVSYAATGIVISMSGSTQVLDTSTGNAELSVGIGFVVQTSAATISSTAISSVNGIVRAQAAMMASFQAAAAAATSAPTLPLLGVG